MAAPGKHRFNDAPQAGASITDNPVQLTAFCRQTQQGNKSDYFKYSALDKKAYLQAATTPYQPGLTRISQPAHGQCHTEADLRAASAAMATIMQLNDYLLRGHRHHQQQLRKLKHYIQRHAWPLAQRRCHDLCAHLDSRFHDEEALLYPLVEQSCRQADGPTTALRYEHDAMREQLEALFQAVCRHEASRCLALGDDLHALLRQHHARECVVLSALCQPAPAHLIQLLRQMQAERCGQP